MAALAGFALVGLGFANMVPVLFSAAGQLPGIAPAQGIAAVASVGYFGMMAGPPLIGFIAEARSLAAGCWWSSSSRWLSRPGAAGARWGRGRPEIFFTVIPRRREPGSRIQGLHACVQFRCSGPASAGQG